MVAMAKFRKKPVVVEAVKVADVLAAMQALAPDARWASCLPEWVHLGWTEHRLNFAGSDENTLSVLTINGAVWAERDEWLIQGVHGELYPCRASIFAATYEPVEG